MMKFILTLFVLSVVFVHAALAQFDPQNPDITKLSDAEVQAWVKKDIAAWKKDFGDDISTWNSLQMEFYKSVRVKALSDSEKQSWISKSDTDWEAALGGAIDSWKVEDMLFYTAIQDLKDQ